MGMQLKLHIVTIEDLVPEGHFLRKLEATLDLSFVREETAHLYNRRYGRLYRPPLAARRIHPAFQGGLEKGKGR